MPKTTEIPGNALYDNLRDTGRTTAGLAQQQTQIFQDWTRPIPRPVLIQAAQGIQPANYSQYSYDEGRSYMVVNITSPGLTPVINWTVPPAAGNLLICQTGGYLGQVLPTIPGWTIYSNNPSFGMVYRWADGTIDDTQIFLEGTWNGGPLTDNWAGVVLLDCWEILGGSVNHATPIVSYTLSYQVPDLVNYETIAAGGTELILLGIQLDGATSPTSMVITDNSVNGVVWAVEGSQSSFGGFNGPFYDWQFSGRPPDGIPNTSDATIKETMGTISGWQQHAMVTVIRGPI